jgi:hypothetical protein
VKKWCPSCRRTKETAAHVSQCREVGRVKTLQARVDFLDEWLEKVGTNPGVRKCIVWYVWGHGFKLMVEVCGEERLSLMACKQDKIGWPRFMKGRVAKHILLVHDEFYTLTGEGPTTRKWASQLVCWHYWKWYMDNGYTVTSKCMMTAKACSGHWNRLCT